MASEKAAIERSNSAGGEAGYPDKLKRDVHVEDVQLARLTEEDVLRMSQEAFTYWSRAGLRFSMIMFVQGCNMAGYGIDWAVISGVNSYDSWHDFFGFGYAGSTYGIINALMTIGTFCGSPFLCFADVIGRRGVNFTGNVLVVIAALLQGLAPNLQVFMLGRFVLGFGTALMSAPQYVAEVAPVHLRGRIVGVFGSCFQVGSTSMNAALIGLVSVSGNWQWRIPFLLQGLFPFIVSCTIWFLTPESPRYLVMKGRYDQAKKVIATYQTTSGEVDQPIVNIIVNQIEESLENERADRFTKYWDYRVFFTRVVAYRTLLIVVYSIFQQWNGGGIIQWYLVPALREVGITGQREQLSIKMGLTLTYFVFTLLGAYLIDKLGRRTLIFSGLIAIIIMQTLSTITSWQFTQNPSKVTSSLTVTWIYLFQVFSASFIAVMHNIYPVELLSLTLRAKGMGLYSMVQSAAGTVQAYGISVGIEKLGYKIWCVYIIYNCLQLVLAYFIFPETFGLTLEEIDAVFETKSVHPVKMSLKIQKAKKERAQIDREGDHIVREL